MDSATAFEYTPFYCEENVWHLAADERFRQQAALVAMITGRGPYRRHWFQRNAASPHSPVYWDYHVILLSREESWLAWDLDTTLGLPVPASTYFDKTFLNSTIDVADTDVYLRLIPAEEYLRNFSSDRAHMRRQSGDWLAPPPEWPAIVQGGKSTLLEWLDIERNSPGRILPLAECFPEFGEPAEIKPDI